MNLKKGDFKIKDDLKNEDDFKNSDDHDSPANFVENFLENHRCSPRCSGPNSNCPMPKSDDGQEKRRRGRPTKNKGWWSKE